MEMSLKLHFNKISKPFGELKSDFIKLWKTIANQSGKIDFQEDERLGKISSKRSYYYNESKQALYELKLRMDGSASAATRYTFHNGKISDSEVGPHFPELDKKVAISITKEQFDQYKEELRSISRQQAARMRATPNAQPA